VGSENQGEHRFAPTESLPQAVLQQLRKQQTGNYCLQGGGEEGDALLHFLSLEGEGVKCCG
jgi:hypothetical protein